MSWRSKVVIYCENDEAIQVVLYEYAKQLSWNGEVSWQGNALTLTMKSSYQGEENLTLHGWMSGLSELVNPPGFLSLACAVDTPYPLDPGPQYEDLIIGGGKTFRVRIPERPEEPSFRPTAYNFLLWGGKYYAFEGAFTEIEV